MSLDDYIDMSDSIKNIKITERLNKEADERKRRNLFIRTNYPKFLYYKCDKCKEYKEYTLFNPILDQNDDKKYVSNNTNEILVDKNGNKVFIVYNNKCSECYNIKKAMIKKCQEHYKTILQDCKEKCECGVLFTKGFKTDTKEIAESYLIKHTNSKKHKDYVALQNLKQDNKINDVQIYLEHLQKKQLIDICKNNNIYGMTNSKKTDIITEILKYKNVKM